MDTITIMANEYSRLHAKQIALEVLKHITLIDGKLLTAFAKAAAMSTVCGCEGEEVTLCLDCYNDMVCAAHDFDTVCNFIETASYCVDNLLDAMRVKAILKISDCAKEARE